MKWDLDEEEYEVLKLVIEGMTNHQIANKLKISDIQAMLHVMSILRKMGVKDRTQAAVKALREDSPDFSGFPPREQQVADCLARGITTDKAIALELKISATTVANYVYRLRKRLNVSSRTAVAVAYLKYKMRK